MFYIISFLFISFVRVIWYGWVLVVMLVNNFSVYVFDVHVSCCFVCHKFWHVHHSPVKLPKKNVNHIFQCENSTSSEWDNPNKWIKVSKICTPISFICAKISRTILICDSFRYPLIIGFPFASDSRRFIRISHIAFSSTRNNLRNAKRWKCFPIDWK